MTTQNKKQFGVWMDTHHATIIGNIGSENNKFSVIGIVTNAGADRNTSENAENNQEKALIHKFFKEITSHMQNVDQLHLTGTGQIQEQFINYLADTPQYKNTETSESTSNKMSDENLIEYVTNYFK